MLTERRTSSAPGMVFYTIPDSERGPAASHRHPEMALAPPRTRRFIFRTLKNSEPSQPDLAALYLKNVLDDRYFERAYLTGDDVKRPRLKRGRISTS